MKIAQRVYFALSSVSTTASEITARVGVEPDELAVRGSKRTTPTVVPLEHSWSIHCRHRKWPLDLQIAEVLDRVTPIADRVQHLVHQGDVTAHLVIVRNLDDEDGEEEAFDPSITEDGQLLEKLGGQHQLLGWHLTPEKLQLLASLHAGITADEYG